MPAGRLNHGFARATVDVSMEASEPPVTRGGSLAVGLLGFIALFPYPAIPVGNNTALQLGHAWSLLLVLPAVLHSWKRRPFFFYPLIMIPMLLAIMKVAFTGSGDLVLCLKETSSWALSGITLLCVQWYAPRYSLSLLTGLACAALVHSGLGFYQTYCFTKGFFPFIEIYQNPSFLEIAKQNPEFEQRPFGLFPEPSAMAASLAPWVLLWFSEICGLVCFKREPRLWQRVLFITASVASILLMLLSRSGHSGVTIIGLVVIALFWLRRCRATMKTYLTIVAVMGVLMPLALVGAADVIKSRTGGTDKMGNDSWTDRSGSMVEGVQMFFESDALTLIFGQGSGTASGRLHDQRKYDAIWSVILPYLLDTGLVGMCSMTYLVWWLLRTRRMSPAKVAFGMILFVWLVGTIVTTSYSQLLSIWMTLGWLTVWPAVCFPSAPAPVLFRRI